MPTLVNYNNAYPFSGIGIVQSIAKEDSYINPHTRWGTKSTLTIRGNITGACSNDFNQLISRQRQLLNSFADDHKELKIEENGQTIFSSQYSVIKSINFPSNRYVKFLPFEVTIENYPQNLFSGVFGIETPTHTVEYQEQDEGKIIGVTRTIGAKGFNTTSTNGTNNALNNAKTWVQSRTGWSQMDTVGYPYFLTIAAGCIPCLQTFKENINRLEGTYEVVETYEFKDSCTGTNFLRYSTEIDYNDQEGLYNVSLQGDFNACQELTITGMRAIFASLNTYDLANQALKGVFPTAPDLNADWLSKSIEEDTNKKNVSFQINYDTDYIPRVMFQPEYAIDFDYVEDIHTITIEGRIVGRGSQKERWERVFNYYNTTLNIFNLVNNFYTSRSLPYTLNPHPLNIQSTFDKFIGEITVSATYDNRPLPPAGFQEWDYTVTVEPSLNLYSYLPNLCQDYIVIDLRAARRAVVSLEGEALALSNTDMSATVRNDANALLMPFIQGTNQILKADSVDRTLAEQGMRYQFSRSVASNGTVFTL
jgi:hypothetical protein